MKWHNNENSDYGEEGKIGDTFTCVVDRINGWVKFLHNNKDLGVAFQDGEIKIDTLYFAVSIP